MTCKKCGCDIRYRQVVVDLGPNAKKHTFCSDGCKQEWTDRRLRWWATLWNRIFVGSYSKKDQAIAAQALFSDEQP